MWHAQKPKKGAKVNKREEPSSIDICESPFAGSVVSTLVVTFRNGLDERVEASSERFYWFWWKKNIVLAQS